MKSGIWLGFLAVSHALFAVAGYVWQSERPAGKAPATRSESPETDEGKEHEMRFAAALKEFGPGTDFGARMKLGVSNYKRRQSPETKACLAAWLEHDGATALRWLATDPNHHDFNEVLLAHIDRHGDEEIASLLDEEPDARLLFYGLIREWMENRKPADLLRIAGQVKSSEARVNLLQSGFLNKPDELIPLLPAIRAMLDERAALEFFWIQSPTREIAEAAEKAGFPDEAVKLLVRQVQAAEASQTSLSKQLAMPKKDGATWTTNTLQEIRKLHPQLAEWTADFAERSLPADELVARLKQAEPELSGRDDETRRLVFAAIFPADAEAATRWLMETRPDWKDILKSTAGAHSSDIRAEEFWRLSGMIEEAGAEPVLQDTLSIKYFHWANRDPQGFLIGLDSLAPGNRRDRLIADVIRIRGYGDKELLQDLVRRIDDPGLRAETEKRSKETP